MNIFSCLKQSITNTCQKSFERQKWCTTFGEYTSQNQSIKKKLVAFDEEKNPVTNISELTKSSHIRHWVVKKFPNSYQKLSQLPSPRRFHGGSLHSIRIHQCRVWNRRQLSPRCRLVASGKARLREPDHPWTTWKSWDEELLPGRISIVL